MAITKIISASGYNVDGSTAFRFGLRNAYYDRIDNPSAGTNFNPTGSILAQDSFFKSFAVNGTATNTRTTFFDTLSHGSALGEITVFNSGAADLSIFLNNAPTGFNLRPNTTYTVTANVSKIDLSTSAGTAVFNIIGVPPHDLTKVNF